MNNFFENHILIEADGDITIEEENEIVDCIRKVLRKRKPNRKLRLLDDFVGRDL